MTSRLFHLAVAGFAAVRRLGAPPSGQRARQLKGHCFAVRLRAALPAGWGAWPGSEGDELGTRLASCLAPLDGADLNELLDLPGDAELVRWIADQLDLPGLDALSLASGHDQGVVLDRSGSIQVWRRFRFESAHRLPRVPPDHPCGRMHGHGFRVSLYAAQPSEDLPAEFQIDRLTALWAPLHAQLHHRCLNEIPGLENPTSEQLAAWIWGRLQSELPLTAVQIEETATAGCRFDGRVYRIWKEQSFEAALRLNRAPAQDSQAQLHGHGYLIRLHLAAPLDPILGWTIDYREVKRLFKPLYDRLDHQRLDEFPGLADTEPGQLVQWIRAELMDRLPALDRIDLYPTPETGVALCWGEAGAELLL